MTQKSKSFNQIHQSQTFTYMPISHQHRDDVISLYSDPAVMSKIMPVLTATKAQKQFLAMIEGAQDRSRDKVHHWAIIHCETGEFVGMQGLFNPKTENKSSEIGIMLKPAWFGKGIAQQALTWLIDKAFNQQNYEKLYADIHSENTAVVKIVKHFGFSIAQDPVNRQYLQCELPKSSYCSSQKGRLDD